MSFQESDKRLAVDAPCRYAGSRLPVRGPVRSLVRPYIAFLGSSDTFGPFVPRPFVSQIEELLSVTCVNLGCANAGVDAFLNDTAIQAIARSAQLVVLQISGVQNMSNPLYRVHPRRNDRFLEASPLLCAIYPEVDFTEFHFNKHMLLTLHTVSEDRFRVVRGKLQQWWGMRMRLLLNQLGTSTHLLWLRHTHCQPSPDQEGFDTDPFMVTRPILDTLGADAAGMTELSVCSAGMSADTEGMVFNPLQAPAAENALGPRAHAMIANQLAVQVNGYLHKKWPAKKRAI